MSIIINNLEIIEDGSKLAFNLETAEGFNITSLLLWKMDDFKDYSLAKNLTYKLQQINNKEVFIITAAEVDLSTFEDVYFIEVDSNEEDDNGCSSCLQPTLGITYNLSKYYQCLLGYFFEANDANKPCKTCHDVNTKPEIISINLLIEMVETSIQLGYYTQAINMIKKLKKLCHLKKCNNCPPINCSSCSKFKIY
ncbi:MAG TPA: hypothetical protein VF680_16830 [Allosphingosinicella sp.]|jgi:hypothetical protein